MSYFPVERNVVHLAMVPTYGMKSGRKGMFPFCELLGKGESFFVPKEVIKGTRTKLGKSAYAYGQRMGCKFAVIAAMKENIPGWNVVRIT